MKKIFAGAVLLAACALFAGCGVKEYTGEYVYTTPYGSYGAKVNVYVRGDKIDRVELVATDYPRVTDSWEGSAVYYAGEQALLDSFSGVSVAEAKTFSVLRDGVVPTAVSAGGIKTVTGATQSTGRLILAVQKALAKA